MQYIVKLSFHFSLASLDQNKMLQGEEGMVVYVDFEMIKNKKTKEKTSVINFENPFKCDKCSERFKKKKYLREHKAEVHAY